MRYPEKENHNTILGLVIAAVLLTFVIMLCEMSNRITDLEQQRDIYKSRSENWIQRATDDEETIDRLQTQIDELKDTITELRSEQSAIEASNMSTKQTIDEESNWTYAGEFFCTAYCCEKYNHICGEGKGITASGAPVTADVTVAADITKFAYGTVLYIEGVGFRTVQDKGPAIKGNRLDIAVDTHKNALSWSGYGNHKVWVVSEPNYGG